MLKSILATQGIHPSAVISVTAPKPGVLVPADALALAHWHMPAGFSPMAYSISLPTDSPVRKMISNKGNFVVNFIPEELDLSINAITKIDPHFTDSFAAAGFTKTKSSSIESIGVAEALARLECEVERELESGNDTVFVGRVMHAHK